MLAPGGGAAAGDSVGAAGSIADTSASRMYRLTPARKARAAAAKISPTVPSEPLLGEAVDDGADGRQDGGADEQLGSGRDHADHFVTYTISQTAENTTARTYQYRAWAATISLVGGAAAEEAEGGDAGEHERRR